METKTLIEAISEHRPNSRMAARNMLSIYDIYSRSFHKTTVDALFHLPDQIKWKVVKDLTGDRAFKQYYIEIDGINFFPKTVSDFISIVSSTRYNLSPRFFDNELSASILWKPNDNKHSK